MSIDKFIKENHEKISNTIETFVDKETAKDIEQNVYIKLWKTQTYTKGMAYVKTVVINACKDFFRSKQSKISNLNNQDDEALLQIKDNSNSPDTRLEQIFRQKTIKNAIDNLPPKYKEVVILYEIEDWDQNQIAKKLNCPVGTVKSRLFKAKKILYEELKHLIKEN